MERPGRGNGPVPDTNPNGPYEPQDTAPTAEDGVIAGQQVPAADAVPENFPNVDLNAPQKCNESGVIQNLTQQDVSAGEVTK